MSGVVANIQAGYDGVTGVVKPKLTTTNVTAIHVTTDAYEDYNVTALQRHRRYLKRCPCHLFPAPARGKIPDRIKGVKS
jgi:hypothetical protein